MAVSFGRGGTGSGAGGVANVGFAQNKQSSTAEQLTFGSFDNLMTDTNNTDFHTPSFRLTAKESALGSINFGCNIRSTLSGNSTGDLEYQLKIQVRQSTSANSGFTDDWVDAPLLDSQAVVVQELQHYTSESTIDKTLSGEIPFALSVLPSTIVDGRYIQFRFVVRVSGSNTPTGIAATRGHIAFTSFGVGATSADVGPETLGLNEGAGEANKFIKYNDDGTGFASQSGIAGTDIATGAITSNKIATSAVTNAKIQDATITIDKIGDGQVGTSTLADGSVSEDKLASSSVSNAKIADNAVTPVKLSGITTSDADQLVGVSSDGTALKAVSPSSLETGVADGAITTDKLADDALTPAKMAGITTGSGAGGYAVALNSAGTAFETKAFPSGGSSEVADGSITEAKLASDSVSQSKIKDDAVGTDQIEDLAVNVDKLAGDAVVPSKMAGITRGSAAGGYAIALNDTGTAFVSKAFPAGSGGGGTPDDNSVSTAKIQDDAVTNAKIDNNAVDTDQLASDAVTQAKIADGAVGEDQLASNSVTASKVANDAITPPKLDGITTGSGSANHYVVLDDQGTGFTTTASGGGGGGTPADGSITTAKLASDAVTNAKLADDAVQTENIADDAITAALLADGSVGTSALADDALTPAKMAGITTGSGAGGYAVALNSAGTAFETKEFPTGGGGDLTDGSVTTSKLDADAVTNAKLADDAVQTENIADDAITNALIANDAVDTDQIADDAVETDKIADDAVTGSKIANGTIGSLQIGDGTIGSAKLLDDSVTTAKIADGAVTGAKIATGSVGANTLMGMNEAGFVRYTPTSSATTTGTGFTYETSWPATGRQVRYNSGVSRIEINWTGLTRPDIVIGQPLTVTVGSASVTITVATITNSGFNGVWLYGYTETPTTSGTLVDGASASITYAYSVPAAISSDKLEPADLQGVTTGSSSGGYAIALNSAGTGFEAKEFPSAGGGSIPADNSVTTAKLASDAVTNAKLADDAVQTENVADDAITKALMADNSVGTDQIENNAVTPAKISGILPTTKGGTGFNASDISDLRNKLGIQSSTSDAVIPYSTNLATQKDGTMERVNSSTGTIPTGLNDGVAIRINNDQWALDLESGKQWKRTLTDTAGTWGTSTNVSLTDISTIAQLNAIPEGGARVMTSGNFRPQYTDGVYADKVIVGRHGEHDDDHGDDLIAMDRHNFWWAERPAADDTSITWHWEGTSIIPPGLYYTGGETDEEHIPVGSVAVLGGKTGIDGEEYINVMVGHSYNSSLQQSTYTGYWIDDDASKTVKATTNTRGYSQGAWARVQMDSDGIAAGAIDADNISDDIIITDTSENEPVFLGIVPSIDDLTFTGYTFKVGTNPTTAGQVSWFASQRGIRIIHAAGHDHIDKLLEPDVELQIRKDDSNYIRGVFVTITSPGGVTQAQFRQEGLQVVGTINDGDTVSILGHKAVFTKLEQIPTINIADDAITNAKIADDAVAAAQLADGAVGTAALADDALTPAKMAGITTGSGAGGYAIALNSAGTAFESKEFPTGSGGDLTDGEVTTAKLDDDAVTNAKLADDAVQTENIADDAITNALVADNAIDTAQLAADAVTGAKIADDAIGNEHIAANAVQTAQLNADAVTGAKIADDAVDTEHLADDAVESAAIADGAVITAALAADAVTEAKLADNAVVPANIKGVTAGSGIASKVLAFDSTGNSFTAVDQASGGSGTGLAVYSEVLPTFAVGGTNASQYQNNYNAFTYPLYAKVKDPTNQIVVLDGAVRIRYYRNGGSAVVLTGTVQIVMQARWKSPDENTWSAWADADVFNDDNAIASATWTSTIVTTEQLRVSDVHHEFKIADISSDIEDGDEIQFQFGVNATDLSNTGQTFVTGWDYNAGTAGDLNPLMLTTAIGGVSGSSGGSGASNIGELESIYTQSASTYTAASTTISAASLTAGQCHYVQATGVGNISIRFTSADSGVNANLTTGSVITYWVSNSNYRQLRITGNTAAGSSRVIVGTIVGGAGTISVGNTVRILYDSNTALDGVVKVLPDGTFTTGAVSVPSLGIAGSAADTGDLVTIGSNGTFGAVDPVNTGMVKATLLMRQEHGGNGREITVSSTSTRAIIGGTGSGSQQTGAWTLANKSTDWIKFNAGGLCYFGSIPAQPIIADFAVWYRWRDPSANQSFQSWVISNPRVGEVDLGSDKLMIVKLFAGGALTVNGTSVPTSATNYTTLNSINAAATHVDCAVGSGDKFIKLSQLDSNLTDGMEVQFTLAFMRQTPSPSSYTARRFFLSCEVLDGSRVYANY